MRTFPKEGDHPGEEEHELIVRWRFNPAHPTMMTFIDRIETSILYTLTEHRGIDPRGLHIINTHVKNLRTWGGRLAS